MYAIAYDFDTDALKTHYPNPSFNNAYSDFSKLMEKHGFTRRQGSVLYGNEKVTAVSATLAIVDASSHFAWLEHSIVDIRILRILDKDDLMPAVKAGSECRKL